MPQRVIVGAGLAIFLNITAASIGFDVKSRSETSWVDQIVGSLKKISGLRLLVSRAESAARGFELYRGPAFNDEFQATRGAIAPALANLRRALRDNPDQVALLEGTEQLVLRRLDIAAEAMRLRAANERSRARPKPAV